MLGRESNLYLLWVYQNLVWKKTTCAFLTSPMMPPTMCRLTFSGVIFHCSPTPTPPSNLPVSNQQWLPYNLLFFVTCLFYCENSCLVITVLCLFYLDNNEVFLFSQFIFSVKDIFHERAWLMSSVFSVQVSGLQSCLCLFTLLSAI